MSGKKKKMEEEGEHHLEGAGGMRWLLTYADMITLLLGVFVILASIGSADASKFMNIADQAAEEFNAAKILPITGGSDKVLPGGTGVLQYKHPTPKESKGEGEGAKKKPKGEEGITVEETSAGTLITLSSGIMFDSGSAELRKEAKKMIDKLYPKYLAESQTGIIIKGHTDNHPINNIVFPSNWELSMARAGAVARYLIDEWGMDEARITAAGYSDTKPIAENTSDEGCATNRRVEIFILKSETK